MYLPPPLKRVQQKHCISINVCFLVKTNMGVSLQNILKKNTFHDSKETDETVFDEN